MAAHRTGGRPPSSGPASLGIGANRPVAPTADARLAAHQPVGSVVMSAHVTTPVFEGPFDVLLQLVSDHKVDVYDIPLAQVVDDFVARLAAANEQMDLEMASEFLVIAAILVELKSKRLLPGPDDVDPDEELSGTEERDRLRPRQRPSPCSSIERPARCRARRAWRSGSGTLPPTCWRGSPPSAWLPPTWRLARAGPPCRCSTCPTSRGRRGPCPRRWPSSRRGCRGPGRCPSGSSPPTAPPACR